MHSHLSRVGRRSFVLLALVVLSGTLVGVASGAGGSTPVSPAAGAVLSTSYPLFRWTLSSNAEDADTIYVANRPAITSEGKFLDANVVMVGFPSGNSERRVSQWSSTQALYAGSYWWIINTDGFTPEFEYRNFYSAPSPFRIRPQLMLLATGTRRFAFLRNIDWTVRWRGNVRGLRVQATLRRRSNGRVVWNRRKSESSFIGPVQSSFLSWYAPRSVRRGTPLNLRIAISNGGVVRSRTTKIKAP